MKESNMLSYRSNQNPNIDPNDHTALFQNACTLNGMQCLQVKSASLDKKVSDTEIVSKIDFLNEDGTIFELEPCCGIGGNFAVDFQFINLRGYEAAGQSGLLIGAVIGTF